MTKIANINLDIRKNKAIDNEPIVLRQGDSDVTIEASISNDGYPNVEIDFATFAATKPDGTIISNDPANVNGNVISYPISKHLTDSVGKIHDAYFMINNKITTSGFDISIIPSAQLDSTSVNYLPGLENINKFLKSTEDDWLGRIQQMKAQIAGLDIPTEFKLLMDKALSDAKAQYQPIIDAAQENVESIAADLASKKLDLENNSDELNKTIADIKAQLASVNSFLDSVQKQIIDANTSFTAGQQAQISQSIADSQKKLADSIASMQSEAAQTITDTKASVQQIQQSAKNANDSIQNAESYLKSITALPETFANLSAIKAKYPSGKNGLMVAADNGHKYIWANNSWVDAGVYQAVGIADETVTPEKTTFIDNRLDFEIEIGTISGGVNNTSDSSKLRTKYTLKNPHGITIVRKNENLLYGVSKYVDGVWDGVDYGWMNVNETYIEPGKDVRFNIKKADNSEFTSDEIKNIHNDIEVRFSFRIADYYDLEDLKTEVSEGLLENKNVSSSEFEYGSISGNTQSTSYPNRAHSKDFIQLNKNDKIIFNKDRNIFKYGVSVSNLDGTWNGIDYGWINDDEFIVPNDSIVKLIISYADNRDITESDFNDVTNNAFTIEKTLKNMVETNTKQLADNEEITEKKEAINSISVEYGRLSGASYVFARIPKITNTGKRLFPKLTLTSSDGSLSGNKRPALRYAKDTDSIFTVNAGLFNVSTIEPVGQLIIDGVSLVNTPMTSDNGVPINPDECYPLAIDGNGDLTTYPHNADTANMIAAGVKYAVTAWGKLVDNFEIATTDIENEIVHNGRYIRQSIGQYQNGDYCVCTVDMTRGSVTNEAGLYYKDLAQIFVDKGVKFAFSLDGGGSAETVLGKRQLNPIYEGSEGRAVPTVITFEIDE